MKLILIEAKDISGTCKKHVLILGGYDSRQASGSTDTDLFLTFF